MGNCINLAERFGADYRIGYDEAAATYSERNDPWMMTMPCRLGTIYPQGGTTLAVECDGHWLAARQLAGLPGVRLYQDGDREKTFHFDVADFPAVAAIVQPKKRRKSSPTQLANLAKGKTYQFGHGDRSLKTALESTEEAKPAQTAKDGP